MKRTITIDRDCDLRTQFANLYQVAVGMFREFGHVVVTLSERKRTNPQNDHFHGQIQDIYEQMRAAGSTRTLEKWKRLLAEQFIAENQNLGWEEIGVMPSLDGKRIVQMSVPTSNYTVRQSSAFVEWLYAWGSENGVTFAVDRRAPDQSVRIAA
ncbi:MAG: recombination protein NinB [Casimicrobium sp.]